MHQYPYKLEKTAMNEAVIKERLSELCEVMNASRVSAGGKAQAEGAYVSEVQPADLDESLNNLRLQIRYLVFDLEATRRENRYLRQMLEARHRPENREDDEPPSV